MEKFVDEFSHVGDEVRSQDSVSSQVHCCIDTPEPFVGQIMVTLKDELSLFGCDSSPRSPNVSVSVCYTCYNCTKA